MADIPLKFGSKSQMLDMDAITKSIENTVLSQFQKLTSDLQSELKLELQVPSEITLEKKALNKEINRIKKEINNALKSVSTEVFEKGLEDRWTFNHTGKYGTDKKDRPIKLKDYDKMVDIRDYKNQRLAMIHQLADITDEGIKIKDSKNLHQLIQNIKAYEEALRRLHELSDQKGQKYKPDEGELNFEKLFDGYKLAGDAKTNAEAIAKAFTSTYVSTLQSELEHRSADLAEVVRKIHRQVYRSAGEQEGVGYKYDKEEYSNAVKERQEAELNRDRNEAEIENRIRDEINTYIELENKLNSLDLDLSDDAYQAIEEEADKSISKLRQAIKYLDEYKIQIESLNNKYDFFAVKQESLRDYILNDYEQRTELSTKPREGYLGTLVTETNKSIDAVAKAQKKEDNARQYLDYWKDLLLGLKDTEQMQEVVSDLSAEQIQSSLQELTNKNTELQRRIEELEKEVADYKSVDNPNGQYQTLTVGNIGNELESLQSLEEKLEDVTDAISAKTAAFEDEHTKVTSWLSNETEAVRKLNDELAKVPENASGINIKPTPGFTITSPSSVSNNHQSMSHDDVVQQHKELASAKHLVVEATADEINAQRELNAEREKAVKEDTAQSNANSLSSQQAIADVIKEQAVAKASVIEQEEKLADVGNEVSDQVQSETKALSQQKIASDQLVTSSEKRVAISMRDIELQVQAEQSARRQAEAQEANYKAAEAAAQQAKLEAAALKQSSAQSSMSRASSFRDAGLQLQAEQSAEHQSAIWKENSRLASDVANQIQIQAAAQQKANKASQEALKIQARLKDDAWAEARAKVLAQEAEEKSAKQKQPKESKPSDPRSVFVDSQNDIDKLTKLYDKIAELETKQSLTGLTPKETASLKQARVDAEQLFEVIKGFATDGERGAQWIQTMSKQLDASKADSIKKWSDAYRELSKSLGQLIGTDVKSSEEVLDKLQEHVKNLGGGKLADFSWIKRDAKGVDHFAAQFEAADGKAKQLNATLNGVDGSLRVIVQDSKQNASLLDQFMSGLGKRWQSLLQYLGTFASFYKVVDIIKRGVGIVKELDAAFVELKRISNDSASALEDFRRRQFELADTVGSTSATIINAATEWEHLGYSIKEAEELAKTSAVYKNIADGMTSDSEATEDLVSILKAYNKDAKDAMDVTDALIATSNNYAVTAADIGNILKRSSAALAMGGNTFEETVALGTAMNEVLQQAEVAGSSLKVLSLRLRSSKTELADMGEETDNLVESTPKLRAQIKALTNGFDILGSDGKTIKSTYDIMKGIASVWKDMSDVNQAALLELIAGKTRAQGVSALLSNWSQVDKVLQTIAEDEGTALRNNEAKLNTINGRVIQLTNASQKLAQDAFNVDVIKGFISGVTGAVNALDALIRKIGVIPTALGAIGAASSFTKGGGLVGTLSDIIDKRAQGRANLQKLSDVSFTGAQQFVLENLDKYDVGKVTKELGELSEAQKMVFDYMSANPGTSYKDALSSLRGEAEKASKTLFSFGNIGQTAFKLVGNAVLGMAAGAALQAVVKTISDAISYQDRLNQSASNYAAQMSSAQKSIAGYKTQIQDLQAKINDQNSSIEEVTKARESLRSLQAEMIDVYGREADGIDIVTQAINGNIDALDRLEAAQFRRQKGKMISEHSGWGDSLGRFFSDIFDWNMGDTGNVKHDTVSNDIKDKIEEYSINFSQAFKDTSNIAIVEALEKSKATYKWESNNVTGDVRDITATLQDMTSAADKEYRAGRMTDEEYSKFTNTISGMLAKVQETYDANIDWYNDMMRYDVVGNDENLSDSYKKLEALAKKYRDNADDKDQRQQIIDEYNSIIDGINNSDSIDQNVKRYFNELYPSLKAEVGQWEFESKLTLKIDDGKTKSEIQKALDELQRTMGDKTVTKEMLDNWDDAAHDSTQNAAYANYTQTLYANGASQVSAGNEAVANAGILSTDNLEELKNQIHSINNDILKDIDETLLTAVKDVNGLPNKFKSIYNRIRRNFDNDTDAVIATLKLIPREAEKAGNQTEKSLSGLDLSDTAQHLNKLAEVIGKIQDKGTVPYTTLGAKDFEDAFGKIDDSTGEAKKAYDDFMKTVSSTKDMDEVIDKANKLATAYFNNSEQMKKLTADNAVFVEGMLSENGVSNAHEVVAAALAKQAASAELAAWNDSQLEQNEVNLRDATSDNIEVGLENAAAFIAQKDAADPATAALANLMFQEAMLSGADIDTTAAQASLQALGQAAGMSAAQIATAISLMNAASSAASKAAVKAKAAAANAGKNPRGKDGGVVWGSEEWNAQMAAYNQAKQAESIAEMNAKMLEDLKIEPIQTGSSGGGGGGGGGGNKEPSKTDKEFDYVNRYLQILQEQNEELRGKVDNQYVILQDAEDNAAEFSEAIGRLGEAEQELNSLGVYYGEDEFTEFLKTLDLSDTAETLNENVGEIEDAYKEVSDIYDDTPGLVHPVGYQDGDTFLGAEIEDYDKVITAAKKYKKALSDVEKAKDKTSKTLDENGTGQLTFIKQLQESDKQLIAAYEHAADSYKTEWEDYKDKILEAFKEDGKGEKYIQDIMFGNLDPEEWERMITYDSNDQTMKDNVELLERAQTAYDHNKESLKSMREWQQKLNDDVQKEYEMRLNIVKAEMTEIESRMNEAQHDLDMKEILGEVVQEADYQRLINISEEQVANYEKQLDVLNEQLGTLDEGEQAWYDCKSQIADCEQNIRECVKQQAEWNDTILRMPVENISRFLGLIQNLGQTLKNWLSVNDAKGIAQNAEQIQTSWTTAFDQVADDELGLMKQLEDYQTLLDESGYELGSTKFSEIDDEIQSARDSVSSLIEEMIELNKQILSIPIDKIAEMTTYLDGTLSDLQAVQSDYETTINTVIDLITKEQEKLEDEYSELEEKIKNQISPLEKQLEELQKANDARDRQLQLESALLELEKAREQKTVQVKLIA